MGDASPTELLGARGVHLQSLSSRCLGSACKGSIRAKQGARKIPRGWSQRFRGGFGQPVAAVSRSWAAWAALEPSEQLLGCSWTDLGTI